MAIFRTFRDLLAAIRLLVQAIEDLARAQTSASPAMDRLDALELSRHQFEAEVAGALLEAKGKLKAAGNAEARERQLKKSYETNLDTFHETGGAGSDASPILPDDVTSSETERLSALHLGVAPTNKSLAIAAKWGRAS